MELDRLIAIIPQRTYRIRGGIARGLKHRGLGLRQVVVRPAPDSPEIETLRAQDLGGRTVYDIGAEAGWFTSFFADRAGGRGSVISFEPHPVSYERTLEQVRVNGQRNVTVLNVAVGDEDGHLTMTFGDQPGQGSADAQLREMLSANPHAWTVQVPVVRIDTVIEQRDLPLPDFVKIDVEGLERAVLRGMSKTIERAHPSLFIELHGLDMEAKRANARGVVELLLKHGYKVTHVESGCGISTVDDARPEGHLLCH